MVKCLDKVMKVWQRVMKWLIYNHLICKIFSNCVGYNWKIDFTWCIKVKGKGGK
jgi:hypothetical protein